METQELDLIARLTPTHDELRHLMHQHQGYEQQLTRLESVHYPSEAERREINRIKRLKLRGKDKIRAILSQHSQA